MGINKTNLEGHCYFNTVKKGKLMFSILDQKRAKAIKVLQKQYTFLYDKDFINALECNAIMGVAFGRRDMKIANEIYGYSKGTADGTFKHPRTRIKMVRTTKDIAALLSTEIFEYYKNIHLDLDVLFVN